MQLAEQAIRSRGTARAKLAAGATRRTRPWPDESITSRYDELALSLDEQLGLEPTREARLIYRQLLGQTQTDGDAYPSPITAR